MSKKILLIESDTAFSRRLRAEFEGKGFTVAETTDGKTAVDVVRRESPDLIVLAVELSAGQSGYIVCGKLKKDEELKRLPVIITGKDAAGFESHKRLRFRAEDYLRKPFEPAALLEKVAALIGLPEEDQLADVVFEEDESLGLGSLTDDEPMTVETDAFDSETRDDPDLDLLDAAFETVDDDETTTVVSVDEFGDVDDELTALDPIDETPVEAPPQGDLPEETFEAEAAIESLGADDEAEAAFEALTDDVFSDDGFTEEPIVEELSEVAVEEELSIEALEEIEEQPPAPPPLPRSTPRPAAPIAAAAALDTAELDALREKVRELENKVGELQYEVSAKTNELEALRSTTGGRDQEYFDLKEQSTRKDKEILRLKQDLNSQEQEVLDLREKETALERQLSEKNTELATREAQIKTLSQKVESLNAEKRKAEQTAISARDELRNMSATLATAQGELDQAQDTIAEKEREVAAARGEAEAARAELDGLREQLEEARREAEAAREEAERLRSEAEVARADLDSKSAQWEEESRTLRARIAELEEANGRNEERVVKAYQKIKVEEKLKEKTRKALAVAMQLLDENAVSASSVVNAETEEEALS